MKELFAIAHDGTTNGDGYFLCPDNKLPFQSGMTLNDIKKLYPIEKLIPLIVGAWIVDQYGLIAINAMWKPDPTDYDGIKLCNHLAKIMAVQICVDSI